MSHHRLILIKLRSVEAGFRGPVVVRRLVLLSHVMLSGVEAGVEAGVVAQMGS
ncbi:MAG: hypothetical protein H6561_21365 [Lewinellaceae bacterium]|nr:hypothetical protein [Lewinellaceae bacterium]HPG08133.1 hypothetical protein [Saprospiraceae bacterium]